MDQQALFFERIEDALDCVINAAGGRKRIAAELWPDKPLRDAHNLLDACLNPERRERFTPSQVQFIARKGREANCHAVMQFLARECGYSDPQPIEPEDERAALMRQFIEAQKSMQHLAKQMERVGLLKAVA
jgi:hypothetical protein